MGFLATRAAARAGKAAPIPEDISTRQALERSDNEPFSSGRYGACNMGKMFIDLFFPDSQRLGDFPSAHVPVSQEEHHLLANCLHVLPLFFNPVVHHPATALL
jgi:hypothetical protein